MSKKSKFTSLPYLSVRLSDVILRVLIFTARWYA